MLGKRMQQVRDDVTVAAYLHHIREGILYDPHGVALLHVQHIGVRRVRFVPSLFALTAPFFAPALPGATHSTEGAKDILRWRDPARDDAGRIC